MTDSVVKVSYVENEIAMVSLEDKVSRNTFSKKFITDLLIAFEEINHNTKLKVVIVHGFDNYFCCGGTQEELLNLTKGTQKFTDLDFYRLLLDCPTPVISAMQGHAVGGGFAFGSFADILVMGLECMYTTNFMKYGFTPGFGSTYIIPKVFGKNIGNNMLFGAQNYQGVVLNQWGVGARFVRKAAVIETAIKLAKNISLNSREKLLNLKSCLRQKDKLLLPKYIEQEVAMHAVSFILPEVKERILSSFGK